MSRYELEEALTEFIQNAVGCENFASYDHDHGDDTQFEDKVYQYLGDHFTVGTGCRVQQAFEQSVRAVIVSFLDNEAHEEGVVRMLLQSILSTARNLPTFRVLSILSECNAALAREKAMHDGPIPANNVPV